VFTELEIEREALAALRLFCVAPRQECATVQLAKTALAALDASGRQRARSRPADPRKPCPPRKARDR
jgi:hypothetical protein